MSLRASPPFRADHVGSLLRTAPLKEARAKHEKGEISADALKANGRRTWIGAAPASRSADS